MLPPVFAPPSLPVNSGRRRRPLIRLTPLIDVVFILLVFFMLASSFVDWRSIALAPAGRPEAQAAASDPLLVVLHPDGVSLAGQRLPREVLVARVREDVSVDPTRPVVVAPAVGVVLQDTVHLIDQLAQAGVAGLSLSSEAAP